MIKALTRSSSARVFGTSHSGTQSPCWFFVLFGRQNGNAGVARFVVIMALIVALAATILLLFLKGMTACWAASGIASSNLWKPPKMNTDTQPAIAFLVSLRNMSNRWHLTHYKLLVVGPADLVSLAIRTAWNEVGVELLGPVAFHRALAYDLRAFHGVLVDIKSGDNGSLLELSERLEDALVPSLFVLQDTDYKDRNRVFVLSDRRNEIDDILSSIFHDGDDGVRH